MSIDVNRPRIGMVWLKQKFSMIIIHNPFVFPMTETPSPAVRRERESFVAWVIRTLVQGKTIRWWSIAPAVLKCGQRGRQRKIPTEPGRIERWFDQYTAQKWRFVPWLTWKVVGHLDFIMPENFPNLSTLIIILQGKKPKGKKNKNWSIEGNRTWQVLKAQKKKMLTNC